MPNDEWYPKVISENPDLFRACEFGFSRLVQLWISPSSGFNNVSVAACNGSVEVLKIFVDFGLEHLVTNSSVFQSAAFLGYLEIVKYLTDLGINSLTINTGLVVANRQGHIEIVKFLLSQGADLSWDDYVCLSDSCSGQPELLRLALRRISLSPEELTGLLYSTILNESIECFQVLIEEGADINSVVISYGGKLPRRSEMVDFLFDCGVKIKL